MSADKKYILLEVDEDRATGLVTALVQRDYIKVMDVNSFESRQRLQACPCCSNSFPKIKYKTIDEDFLWDLLGLIRAMAAHPVVLLAEDLAAVIPFNRARATKFSEKNLKIALILNMIKPITEGDGVAYHATIECIDFVKGDARLTPGKIATAGGKILNSHGSVHINEISSKEGSLMGLLRDLQDAAKKLPKSTLEFIRTGQLSVL